VKTFFEQQQLARRNTRVMVLLFCLAVAAVIVAVDTVLAGLYVYVELDEQKLSWLAKLQRVPPTLYAWGAAGTAGLILAVSTFNVFKLASGGPAVAEMIGARRIAPDTRDALERRFVNVVEEMAIASGVRVPGVYVMDGEAGINAFAAGWDVSGTVVAVTRGTLQTLTRDELQGVVAHEFSHILNGDMRLNIRMIGVLAGIVFIGAIGEFILRSLRSRDSKNAAPIFLAGLALFVIGYVGLFFARLIKAAVSRQREFLADASSVQFTRNPDGIAGALDQIRMSGAGALIASGHAEDLSHMFFGQGIRMGLGGLLDTHPPLDERIKRAHPRFQASSYRTRRSVEPVSPAAVVAAAPAGRRAADAGQQWGRSAGESAQLVGAMDGGKLDFATRFLATLPPALTEAVHEAGGAGGAMIALLLAPKDEVMQPQLEALKNAGLGALAERAATLAPVARGLGPAYRLPVVDLALPALKAAPEQAKKDLVRGLEQVIQADRRVSLHEFVVLTLVRHQLAPRVKPPAEGKKLAALAGQAATLLAIVAHAGTRADAAGPRQQALAAAIKAGADAIGIQVPAALSGLTLEAASAALEALKTLAPLQKALLVKGLFAAVSADGTIRVAEAELMRLVGAVLDCPLPPLLESFDPAALAA
jgi:Zn-dependent protease with chaperone function